MVSFLALGSTLISGCHRTPRGNLPRGDVSVTVTYGGEPVTEGWVDLNDTRTGEGGGGALNGQGVAKLSKLVEGTYVTTVNPPHPTVVVPGQASPATHKKEYPNIPEKFRDIATSPLRAEVKEEEMSEYRFDLKQIE
ncbi:MAG: hypothetical protein IT427_05165 [Pirellulales bacterium]|nr:hypothetical protein [Pirellulales bacterium]